MVANSHLFIILDTTYLQCWHQNFDLSEFHSQCHQKAVNLISLDGDSVKTYMLPSGSKLLRKPFANYSTLTAS